MRKLAVTAIGVLLVLMPLAAAQEAALPTTSITPDNPIYGLKIAIERIQLLMTQDKLAQARLHYQFAEARLAEAQTLAKEGKTELADKTLKDYENELNETNTDLERAVANGKNITSLTSDISDRSFLHIQAMRNMHDEFPASLRQDVDNNINMSLMHQARAVRFIANRNLVNMTITVGNETVTVQIPESMADNIVKRAGNLSEREAIAIGNISVVEGNIADKITECQNLIDDLKHRQLDNAGTTLLTEAETHLDNANQALNNSELGRAAGQTVAGCMNVQNAEKHVITATPNETEEGGGAGPGVKNATTTIQGGGAGPGGY